MKNAYLDEIRNFLKKYDIPVSELNDIINDYSQMFDDGIARGLSEEEVVEFLGLPAKVAADFGEDYPLRERHRGNRKIIALMPFLSTIAFFVLGYFGYWHPGWMVFLAIPLSGIIFGMAKYRTPHIFTALSPFIATGVYLFLGFRYSLWHPGWLVFLLVPVTGILMSGTHRKGLDTLTALSPFLAVTAFIFLGNYGWWNPGWLVFLIIPMLGIWHIENRVHRITLELAFAVAIGIYLWAGFQYGRWDLGALAFGLPVIYGILIGEIHIVTVSRMNLWVKITTLLAVLLFVGIGIWTGAWEVCWLVFLAIPVVAIQTNTSKRDRFVAMTPFIALTIFYLLGYFADLWTISWIAFLLIPIAGILRGK